ncbi:class V lanthionine synthetase subunit LxmK [Streptomyces sp. CNZ287]|uniref:class V lanthionine synthetase subunit LxmK n=1 Tax=Streptomyces sp. B22F1 TaxID=3153566 RepID=UPI00119C8C8E
MTDDIEVPSSARRLMDRLGLGEPDGRDGVSLPGRNANFAVLTSSGRRVFLKQLHGSRRDAVRRFRRMCDFEQIAVAGGWPDGLSTPVCLGWDEDELTIAFEWLEGARSGHELAATEEFGNELANQAGRLVGMVHSLDPEQQPALETDPPRLPPLDFFDCLPLDYFARASGGCLEGWRMLQPDTALAAALCALRAEEAHAERTAAHCDLRLDQFFRHDGTLYLCDWEEFRMADPARDVGSFAGEWLYRAVLEIPSRELDPGIAEPGHLSHQEVVERGVRELDRLRTRTVAFCAGYRESRTATDSGLAARAAGFAGWHLIDRMFAGAEGRPRLTAVERAAAGIGRSAVLAPGKFASALGLEV